MSLDDDGAPTGVGGPPWGPDGPLARGCAEFLSATAPIRVPADVLLLMRLAFYAGCAEVISLAANDAEPAGLRGELMLKLATESAELLEQIEGVRL